MVKGISDYPNPDVTPREQVEWFARVMESRLRANDHKGGWDYEDLEWLLKRLLEEAEELRRATWGPLDEERVAHEAADVANFAMMIADRVRDGGFLRGYIGDWER